jgi:S1 RNA binding domain protein
MEFTTGAVLDGKVKSITNFGAFIALPENKTGLVHISEVSNTFVKEIKDFLKEGQDVRVKVTGISPEGKISLSIKKAEESSKEKLQPKPKRNDRPRNTNVWQGQQKSQTSESMSFEDMMAKFKQTSDDKMSDLKHNIDNKRGGGRRGYNK